MSELASATITGEYPNQKLNLVIPRGHRGEKGDKGDQGIQGIQGIQGPQGIQGVQGAKGDSGDMVDVAGPAPVTGTINITEAMLPSTRIWNLTGNVTITLPTPSATKSATITLVLKQDATGGRTVTWPTSPTLKWTEGIVQAPAAAANSTSVIHLLWTGTEWLGLLGGKSFA